MIRPYSEAVTITPGSPVAASRGVFIACTAAGTVRLKMANSTTIDVPVNVGPNMLDFWSIRDVVAGGTTATAVVTALY